MQTTFIVTLLLQLWICLALPTNGPNPTANTKRAGLLQCTEPKAWQPAGNGTVYGCLGGIITEAEAEKMKKEFAFIGGGGTPPRS